MVFSDDPDYLVKVKSDRNYRVEFHFEGNIAADVNADDIREDIFHRVSIGCSLDFNSRDKALQSLNNYKNDRFLYDYFSGEDIEDLFFAGLNFIPDLYGRKPNPYNDWPLVYDDESLKLDSEDVFLNELGDNNPVYYSQVAKLAMAIRAGLICSRTADEPYFAGISHYYDLEFDLAQRKIKIVQFSDIKKECFSLDINPEQGIKAMIDSFKKAINNLSGYDDLKSFLTANFLQ